MSYAFLKLCKNTVGFYDNQIILNKNLIISASSCIFKGILNNADTIHVLNTDEKFMKNNIHKFLSPNLYFYQNIVDCNTLYILQNHLNKDMNNKIFVNDKYFDKFVNRIENVNKYITGNSYCNDKQIFSFDTKNINDFYIEKLNFV